MPRWSSLGVPKSNEEQNAPKDIISQTQVYVLCIPSRRQHASQLMERWGFDAELVNGPDKHEMNLDELVASGVILESYLDVIWQDVEYMPEGKVACHLGHLNILRRFLADTKKNYALIFEDDLEPGPPDLSSRLREFLSRVPADFDLLHLGFVRESQEARRAVDGSGHVFRSVEALGRHAYLVTKRVAELLVEHTLPMHNHGDKMFQQVYQACKLRAYHPREPLFYQDRINFESELTERWKPSRAFQPTSEKDFIRDCDRPEMERRHQRKLQEQTQIMAMQSKIFAALFLNIDGVLNTVDEPFASSRCGRAEKRPLQRLAHVLQRAPSCVVLTSPWRLDERYAGRLGSALAREGVPWIMAAIAATPDGRSSGSENEELRLVEIGCWLEDNTWVQEWAILDSFDLSELDDALFGRVVCTDYSAGLQEEEAEVLVKMLEGTRVFGISCPCTARYTKQDYEMTEDDRSPVNVGTVLPGSKSCHLAGFVGAFPWICSTTEMLEPPVGGAVDSVARTNEQLARYMYNDVKVCDRCGRPCAHNQKACQGCGHTLENVPITQTENVMMGFIFGVERTLKFPLMISIRRQTDHVIVFDDLLAMSTCHLNALLTSHYCQDWRWLLRDPSTALGLLDEMEAEAWQATLSFFSDEQWRKFVYREGVTKEMVRDNIICGFNSPPSQYQLHLQWIVLPLMPFHHSKLLDGLHAQRGRWFPLEYVRRILDELVAEGKTFDIRADTPVDEIIQYFNSKGVYYEEVWAECYQKYCASYALSNWKAEDFKYVVLEGQVHEIQEALPGGHVRVGNKLHLDPVSKLQLEGQARSASITRTRCCSKTTAVEAKVMEVNHLVRTISITRRSRSEMEGYRFGPVWKSDFTGLSPLRLEVARMLWMGNGTNEPAQIVKKTLARAWAVRECAEMRLGERIWQCLTELFHVRGLQAASELLVVYCIDPRHWEKSPWGDHRRCGPFRSRLIAESLEALAESLRSIGSRLVAVAGRPEEVLPQLLPPGSLLVYQAEDTHDEQQVEEAILGRLPANVEVRRHFGQTLRNREDLGFDILEWLPLPFGKFYHETCAAVTPRQELPTPGQLPPSKEAGLGLDMVQPVAGCLLQAMGLGSELLEEPTAGEFAWRGGESEAWKQLESFYTKTGLGRYQHTRNQLHCHCSSRLSPWMAIGCLSPRSVFWRAVQFERENGKDNDGRFDHVQKFIFQLCWRDYFHFYCAHFGRRVFFLSGPARRARSWRRDAAIEESWKQGRTGVPLVDALMRELAATGFMANRGRYIVASYLIHYLNIDWRVGADWFESLLLDHDVCSNYGEWASMANIAVDLGDKYPLGLKGRGPTGGRRPGARGGGGDPWARGVELGDSVFDPFEQARQYDRDESYVRRWVPELRSVPVGSIHAQPRGPSGYPSPVAVEPVLLSRRCVRPPAGVKAAEEAEPKQQSLPRTAEDPPTKARPARRWQAKGTRSMAA
ncbi:cry-dash [Symbiodinium microadriaticum]|nr:cry-dash [Symbiodinium microadriaticum]